MAKMAHGHADDLASAVLLATDRPILLAPRDEPADVEQRRDPRNVAQARRDGVHRDRTQCRRNGGAGEAGVGRMAEPRKSPPRPSGCCVRRSRAPLAGKRILITAGPTHEPIDPVRYIANRSSGKQGYAIAARRGGRRRRGRSGQRARSISPIPPGVTVTHVETARDMLQRSRRRCRRISRSSPPPSPTGASRTKATQKLKKDREPACPPLQLVENPDISRDDRAAHDRAAETRHRFRRGDGESVDNARAKLARKGCDWIVANDVSAETGVMGGDRNTVHLLSPQDGAGSVKSWPAMTKEQVARDAGGALADPRGTTENPREQPTSRRYPAIAAWRRPAVAGLSERAGGGSRPVGGGPAERR